jgi:hypothetical protein
VPKPPLPFQLVCQLLRDLHYTLILLSNPVTPIIMVLIRVEVEGIEPSSKQVANITTNDQI